MIRSTLLTLLSNGRSARVLVGVVHSLPVLLRLLSDATKVLGVMRLATVADIDGSSFAKKPKAREGGSKVSKTKCRREGKGNGNDEPESLLDLKGR